MSSVWAPLLPAAMVGTERAAPAALAWEGAVGALASDAMRDAGEASIGLLRAAAVLSTCEVAGSQGSPWTESLPAPATADARPPLPAGPLVSAIAWTLQEGPTRLQHQVCLALDQAGYRLPPTLLPQMLELGRRSLALRPVLSPVLGERGAWLATLRDDWRYAAGVASEAVDETLWQEGSIDQRRAFLRRERLADPAAARARLEASLAELPAKERADLLGVLATGLDAADEPLLETLRSDRAREVRQAALGLLLRRPASGFTVRAAARVEGLLRHERVLLRKRWLIEAPEAIDPAWKADHIDAVRPKSETLGERAWWLYQLVRQVPLGWWTTQTGMTAAELREWADGTDWAEALLRGWRDVLFTTSDVDWSRAFLARWPKVFRDDESAIVALLPPAARIEHWQRHVRDPKVVLAALLPQMMAACPFAETFPHALSDELAALIRARSEAGTLGADHALRIQLPELCCVLHLDSLPRLGQLAGNADDFASLVTTLREMQQIIAVRQQLRSLTPAGTP